MGTLQAGRGIAIGLSYNYNAKVLKDEKDISSYFKNTLSALRYSI